MSYRCSRCLEVFPTETEAESHAEKHGGARVDQVLQISV